MQERRHRLLFVAAVFADQRSDGEHVGDVRRAAALSMLLLVMVRGERESVAELGSVRHAFRRVGHACLFTYSNATGWPLMPWGGGAIQWAMPLGS